MRALVGTCRGEWPKTSRWPLVGYSSPRISLTVVDLPEPFGPSNPKTSPRRTSKSTLSTARALGRPQKSLKTLVSPRTETMTSPEVGGRRVEGGGLSVSVMEVLWIESLGCPAKDSGESGLVQLFSCQDKRFGSTHWAMCRNRFARSRKTFSADASN